MKYYPIHNHLINVINVMWSSRLRTIFHRDFIDQINIDIHVFETQDLTEDTIHVSESHSKWPKTKWLKHLLPFELKHHKTVVEMKVK